MSDTDNIPKLYVDVVEYPEDNTFVAECLELPIIIEAETVEKVEEKMNLAVKDFLKTFPEDMDRAIKKGSYRTVTEFVLESARRQLDSLRK